MTQPAILLQSFSLEIMALSLQLVGVAVITQVRVVLLEDDMCHLLHSLGTSAVQADG